jgi:hypothetical protein
MDMDWGIVDPMVVGLGTRKRLVWVDVTVNMPGSGQGPRNTSLRKVALQIQLLENGNVNNNVEKSETTPQKVQAPKRQKKVVNGEEVEENLRSATSDMEDRRQQ